MRIKSTAAAVSLVLLVGGARAAAAQSGGLSAAARQQVDSAVAAIMTKYQATGIQAAIGIDDSLVWTGGSGWADLEDSVPVTARSLFRTASVTKWMTATAVMALVERGQLDLDAPVQRYCPQFPEKRWPVTTRQLLAHRGGVRHYWGANLEPRETDAQRLELQRRSDDERLGMIVRYTDVIRPLNRFRDDSLLFEPGTRYHYTSYGYRVVGCVLQGAGDTTYNALMQKLVFEPAGMTSTVVDDALAIVPGRVRGYTRNDQGELQRSRFRDVSENLPAGGHLSTAADLVRFALAFQNDVLIKTETQILMVMRWPGTVQSETYYGLGVNVRRVPSLGGALLLDHSGGQDETRTLLVAIPSEGLAVAVMTNYEPIGDGLTELTNALLAIAALEPSTP